MARGDQSPIRTLPNRNQRSGQPGHDHGLGRGRLLKPTEEELKRISANKPRELGLGWGIGRPTTMEELIGSLLP
jgi:hypothetical protein